MDMKIEVSIDTATHCYAVLTTALNSTRLCLARAENEEDRRFWAEAVASNEAAHAEIARRLFPLSHPRKAA